jgi:hypothetical protein
MARRSHLRLHRCVISSHVTAFMVAEDATQTRGESQAARNSGGGSTEGGRPNLKRDIAHRLGGF